MDSDGSTRQEVKTPLSDSLIQDKIKASKAKLSDALVPVPRHSNNPIGVIIFHTISSLFSLRQFILSVGLLSFIPVLFVTLMLPQGFASEAFFPGTVILESLLVTPGFMWTAGLCLIFIVGSKASGLLVRDLESGEMLMTLSKPISRNTIYLAKFLGLIVSSMILSMVSLLSTGFIVSVIVGNISYLPALIPLLFCLFGVSCIVILFFGSIGIFISSLVTHSRNSSSIMIFLILGLYLLLIFVRLIIGNTFFTMQLYHIDLVYHVANIFASWLEITKFLPLVEIWQSTFNMFTGVYTNQIWGGSYQGFEVSALTLAKYYDPWASFILLIVLSICFLIIGLVVFRRREIR